MEQRDLKVNYIETKNVMTKSKPCRDGMSDV